MFGTFNPAGPIQKIGRDPPQGHEQPSSLAQPIIARARFKAPGTFAPNASMGSNADFDAAGPTLTAGADLVVDESNKMLNVIEYRFNFKSQ